jgi:hypothetical protein
MHPQLFHGPIVHGAAAAESEKDGGKQEQSNFHGHLLYYLDDYAHQGAAFALPVGDPGEPTFSNANLHFSVSSVKSLSLTRAPKKYFLLLKQKLAEFSRNLMRTE